MLVFKMALALGLASMPSMSAFAANDSYSARQSQEWIASNSPKAINNENDTEWNEQPTPPEPSLKKADSDTTKLMRKQLFNRYFPKNWSWW